MALHSVRLSKLPSKGTPGDVFYTVDAKQTYWVCTAGTLLCLNDLAAGTAAGVRTVGPQGETGLQGAQGPIGLTGPRGERGTNGAPGNLGPKGDKGSDGHNGDRGKPGERGPQGERGEKGDKGDKGDRGERGERGEILYVGPAEMAAEIKKLRAEIVRQRAAILAGLIDRLDGIKNAQVKRHLEIHLQSIQQDFERLSH